MDGSAVNPYGVFSFPLLPMAGVLLLFHLWYDFHVQGAYISAGKRTSTFLLSVHALTWSLFVSIPLYLVGTLTVEQFAFLFLVHWAMDWIKSHKMPNTTQSLMIDQFVHIVQLGVVLWQW